MDYVFIILSISAIVLMLCFKQYYFTFLITLSILFGKIPLFYGFNYWMLFSSGIITIWLIQVCISARPTKNAFIGPITFIPIAIYCSILLFHFVLNFMGMGTGSKGGYYLTASAFFIIVICYLIHTEKFDLSGNRLIPLLALMVGMFELVLEIMIWVSPGLLSEISIFYSMINQEFSAELQGDIPLVTHRVGFRTPGLMLGLFCSTLLVTSKIKNAKKSLALLSGALLSFVMILYSGYRSALFALLLIFLLAGFYRFRLKIIPIIIFTVCILILSTLVYHNHVSPLPVSMQRTLTWLPVDWEPFVEVQTESSWTWRYKIWTYFMNNIFWESPWVGQGYRYFPDDRPKFLKDAGGISFEEDYALYTANLHSGFFGTLDSVGIIGLICLLILTIRACYNGLYIYTYSQHYLAPWMLWIIFYYFSNLPSFWITGSFESHICRYSIYASAIELMRYQTKRRMPSERGTVGQLS